LKSLISAEDVLASIATTTVGTRSISCDESACEDYVFAFEILSPGEYVGKFALKTPCADI
jgi:hypothetical protein